MWNTYSWLNPPPGYNIPSGIPITGCTYSHPLCIPIPYLPLGMHTPPGIPTPCSQERWSAFPQCHGVGQADPSLDQEADSSCLEADPSPHQEAPPQPPPHQDTDLHPLHTHTHTPHEYMVNKRASRILLECIIVDINQFLYKIPQQLFKENNNIRDQAGTNKSALGIFFRRHF